MLTRRIDRTASASVESKLEANMVEVSFWGTGSAAVVPVLVSILVLAGAVLATWWHAECVKRVPLFKLADKRFVLETIQWLPAAEQERLLMQAERGITRRHWRAIRARVDGLVGDQLGEFKGQPPGLLR
jgi:hypothetical protein